MFAGGFLLSPAPPSCQQPGLAPSAGTGCSWHWLAPSSQQPWLAPNFPSSCCSRLHLRLALHCIQVGLFHMPNRYRYPRLHLCLALHCIQAGRPLPPSEASCPTAADIRSCDQGPAYSQDHSGIHALLVFFSETAHPAAQFSHSHPSAPALLFASPGCSLPSCSRTSNPLPPDDSWARQQPWISPCWIPPCLS